MSNWLCPLCGLRDMPYGTTCAEKEVCKHWDNLHLTGQSYKSKILLDSTSKGGISNISDEKDSTNAGK